MGAHPFWYFVPHEANVKSALEKLRAREFRAGRYNPVTPFPSFPVDVNNHLDQAAHANMDEALRDAGASGTRSILDIFRGVSEVPGFCQAAPLSTEELTSFFGSAEPTRSMVETNLRALSFVERAYCVYIVVYENGRPNEILFFGYSFD